MKVGSVMDLSGMREMGNMRTAEAEVSEHARAGRR